MHHIIKFQSPTHENLALKTLQEKVGDSVIIVKEHEYAVTDIQKQKLDEKAIFYKYIKEVK